LLFAILAQIFNTTKLQNHVAFFLQIYDVKVSNLILFFNNTMSRSLLAETFRLYSCTASKC